MRENCKSRNPKKTELSDEECAAVTGGGFFRRWFRSGPVSPAPMPTVARPEYYTVQPTDTPESIAAVFGTTVFQLCALNGNCAPDLLSAGMRIRIK